MRRTEFTDYPFDKEAFKAVIQRAKGDRSQADFCEECGLSYSYISRYANGKTNEAPTLQTIKKIALATKSVTYEELLTAAGYDADKYRDDRPIGAFRKDFIYPVFIGITNSPYDWRIESSGCKDGEPFEIIIERQNIKKWFFVPVTKEDVTKDDVISTLLNQPKFVPGSKVSFITDDDEIFKKLKVVEFPLISLCVSVIKVAGQKIVAEESIITSSKSDLSILNEDEVRPYTIGENY